MTTTPGLALLVAGLAIAGCDAPAPAVVALSVTQTPEGVARPLVLATEGCAPPFDLDRGALAADPTATLRLDPGARTLSAHRTGDEQFEADLPDDLMAGNYALELDLSDGRRARYNGTFLVRGSDVLVEGVSSPRMSVVPGEPGVPLTVALYNKGLCPVDGLVVEPLITALDGTDLGAQFHAAAPPTVHLEPMARATVTVLVDVSSTAQPATVQLDARGHDGMRGPDGACSGSVAAHSAGPSARWLVLAPSALALEVSTFNADPSEARPGSAINVTVRVLNQAAADVVLDTVALHSDPEGMDATLTPAADVAGVAAGATSHPLTLDATVPADAVQGSRYVLSLEVLAHDASGNTYSTGASAPMVTVTVNAHN